MIKVECDNCERELQFDEALAGTKKACPYCGDVNRLPAADQPVQSSPKAAPVEDANAEKQICVVRPGMFRARPFRYLALVVLILGGAIWAGMAQWSESVANWMLWPALIFAIAGLAIFGWWWMSTHYWIRLIVSNKRSIRHEGIVKRHTTEVLHDHVRSVDIQQNFLQRMLGVGDIGIDSPGQDGVEIEVRDIPGPYKVKEIIDKHRKM